MSKLIPLFFLFALFSIHTQAQEEILTGKISVSELKEAPYSEWYSESYDTYALGDLKTDELVSMLEGVEIKIFMGTWCSDSQREIPRFYKIMDGIKFQDEDLELIAVNREKTTPERLEENLDIRRVPTFIFYKDGEEMGRIVEYPIESLEADMLKILSGEEYEHAYAQ